MVPTAAQIALLPEFTFAKRWKDFSACLHQPDRAPEDGTQESGRMSFVKAYRLAAAIGTSLRALETFPSQGHLMYAAVTESREVRVALNRLSLQYMIRSGGSPYHSGKALIQQMVASAIRACSRRNVGILQELCEKMRECRAKVTVKLVRSVLSEKGKALSAVEIELQLPACCLARAAKVWGQFPSIHRTDFSFFICWRGGRGFVLRSRRAWVGGT